MTIDFAALGFGSVDEYQRFHGLEATGLLDRTTQRSLDAPRFCGLPDRMDLGNRVCLWGKRQLTCCWVGGLAGIDDAAIVATVKRAWDAWHAVCGIRVAMVPDAKSADIVVMGKRLDGSGNTLAQAELPCGQHRQRSVEVDNQEPWVTVIDPPRYRVSLVLTLIHEFGHSLGLVHGPPGNIMQATYDSSIKAPRAWDIAEVQSRYGAAPITPTPTDPDEPDGEYVTIPSFKIPKAWVA